MKERKEAQNLANAIRKYVGTTEDINEQLGIVPEKLTKWSKESIINNTSRLFKRYSLTPSQLSNLSKNDAVLFSVTREDIKLAKRIADRTSSYFTGSKEVYSILGITPVDKRILKRRIE